VSELVQRLVTRSGLTLRVVPAARLGDDELEEIWRFYSRFVDRPKTPFIEGVRRTGDVFLGRERGGGPLRAFAAASAMDVTFAGATCGVMYGAWAAIDPAFRGGQLLQWAGLVTWLKYRRRHPLRRTYFVIMASTYTSYLLLTRNFAEYWPRRQAPTPPLERALLDTVMRRVAGSDWDAEAGVVRRYGRLRYREGVVADDGDQGDPEVAYYAARNPGQREGDSLACVAPLSLRNWRTVAWRAVARSTRRR
jgi:hypothetical protein